MHTFGFEDRDVTSGFPVWPKGYNSPGDLANTIGAAPCPGNRPCSRPHVQTRSMSYIRALSAHTEYIYMWSGDRRINTTHHTHTSPTASHAF